jgi:hypothetical protein
MFGKQLDRTRSALDARRERRAMLTRNHQRIAGGKLVRIDVAAACYAMDVTHVSVVAARFGGVQRFSFSLG